MASYESYNSPRMRRLRNDLTALERLRSESSFYLFESFGSPPHRYLIEFHGRSLAKTSGGKITLVNRHQVEIKLGSSYPRTMPELRWLTPMYHPNISEIGMVCLGGYGTHWVPSLTLDELCVMLWDMCRYQNYDIRSPYNREAAIWVANQAQFTFPIDDRPLRDRRVALGRIAPPKADESQELVPVELDEEPSKPLDPALQEGICILDLEVDLRNRPTSSPPPAPPAPAPIPDVVFLD